MTDSSCTFDGILANTNSVSSWFLLSSRLRSSKKIRPVIVGISSGRVLPTGTHLVRCHADESL